MEQRTPGRHQFYGGRFLFPATDAHPISEADIMEKDFMVAVRDGTESGKLSLQFNVSLINFFNCDKSRDSHLHQRMTIILRRLSAIFIICTSHERDLGNWQF